MSERECDLLNSVRANVVDIHKSQFMHIRHPDVINVAEIAEVTGKSESTIRNWARSGKMPPHACQMHGGRWWKWADIESWWQEYVGRFARRCRSK